MAESGTTWKQFTYATANDMSNARKGKLETAMSRNELGAPAFAAGSFANVTETYTYQDRGGRVSNRVTAVAGTGVTSESWQTSQTTTPLGRLENQYFPTCISGPGCTGGPGGTYTTTAYEDGLLKTITANGGGFLLSSITYHPSGMPNVITHSSGGSMVETITQAAHGMARPNSITITAPNETVPFTTGTYAYDAAGNIKTMGSDHFRYDKYSRLVEAQMQSISPARTQSYGFDPYGNMTSVATTSGPTETFQVIGTSNRITLPAPVALAQYDTGGNLTSWSDPSSTSTYTWDLFNRLTRWSNGAEGWSYVYTADDERLWAIKDVAGATFSNWTFRGLGNEVLVRDERRPAPTPRALTQYAYREGKLLVSLKVGGAFRDHGLDHLGSIRATAEFSLGTLAVRHTYFPFGREATSTSLDAEVMKFTGHERDLQSTPTATNDDLDYMHARYRSPLTSRFLSTDPVLGTPKTPQSWNRYAYTRGNPLKFTDPDGRSILHYIRAKWAQAASNAQESGAAAAGVVADFTPVVSDGKAIYEAYKNPTAVNVIGAAIGLAPGAGDFAAKLLKIKAIRKAAVAGGGGAVANIPDVDVLRIQNAANRTDRSISVVGSRAAGTPGPTSDYDFIVSGEMTSRQQHSLASSLPEGPSLGLGQPRNLEFLPGPVDSSKPHVTFHPEGE